MSFKEGSVVCLKSGGPAMTIEKIAGDDAKCVWIDDSGAHHSAAIGVAALRYPPKDEAATAAPSSGDKKRPGR